MVFGRMGYGLGACLFKQCEDACRCLAVGLVEESDDVLRAVLSTRISYACSYEAVAHYLSEEPLEHDA